MENSKKVIVDLCGGTGSWSRFFEAAGYDVKIITLPEYDVTRTVFEDDRMIFHDALFTRSLTVRYDDVYGILAAPPCTEFSVLNCLAEPRTRRPDIGMVVVHYCLMIIERCPNAWWALENPRGYLREHLGLPVLSFQPWEYGDPWTKQTDIWGSFNIPQKLYRQWEDVPNKLPLYTRPGRGKPNFAFLHKSAWRQIPQLAFHEPTSDAEFRAMTPPGFARAFFEANQ